MRRRDLLRMAVLGAPALRASCPSDYRALVCVMMAGGNDGNNMLVPIASAEGDPLISYSQYAKARGGLAVPLESVVRISAGNGDQLGLHGGLKELGELSTPRKQGDVFGNGGQLTVAVTGGSKGRRAGQAATRTSWTLTSGA